MFRSTLAKITSYYMRILTSIFCLTIFSTLAYAQIALNQNQERWNSYEQNKKNIHPINSIGFKNIGPTIMSGRVVDLAVNPEQPTEFYAAYASGGVWYTNNNGFSFTPIFDKEATHTIGDIEVNWKNRTIWVGTGEVNSSRSSYAGLGIYKSIDSGKTWQHKGLLASQHIGKILLSGVDDNTLYVASLGSLYTTQDGMPGLYKTIDGGNTWQRLNAGENNVGFVDIQFEPNNENTLYATAWARSRKAWNFVGNGVESGIYKSIDAGRSWQCITGGQSGFPKNEGTGRIGIAIQAQEPNLIYALLDNQSRQPATTKKKNDLTALQIKAMSSDSFAAIPKEKLEKYLRSNDYPKKYTAESVKKDIIDKKYKVIDVANWVLDDGDAALFQSPIIGAELYVSKDGGAHWLKTHDKLLEGLYFTYGYYFGNIYTSPTNQDEVYLLGYTLLKSKDGGKTFKEIVKDNVHADHHRLWINPNNPKHLINGNDGGVNITYDDGNKWYKANNPAVGQFYAITTDNATPYNVYGGLQDNGTWVGPSDYTSSEAWHQDGEYPYKFVGGGDGMQVQVDTRDNNTMYTGSQFGFYQRSDRNKSGTSQSIHPTYDIGKAPLRYNWQTPILLSRHNQDILYMGSNAFHRSMNKGSDIKQLNDDLASTNNKGNVPFGTITTITESPKQFGLLYIGTDNGKMYKSTDVGASFEPIKTGIKNIDNELWVSRIIASKHEKDKVYASFNGYRNDNFTPYLLVSTDQGKSWKLIGDGIAKEPINVVREDPKKENIVYVGTDNGLYISYNSGATFIPWQSDLPRVAIHDIAIQERDNDILLGTHGRSIYKANLNYVQMMDSIVTLGNTFFAIDSVKFNESWGNSWASYSEANSPEIKLNYFTNTSVDSATLIVKTLKGKLLHTAQIKNKTGFNSYIYKGTVAKDNQLIIKAWRGDNDAYYLSKGKYIIEIIANNQILKQELRVY